MSMPPPSRFFPLRTRKWLLLALLICLGAGAYAAFSGKKTTDTDTDTKIYTVEKGNVEEIVTAQGKLEPKQYVDVGTQVSGQIKKLYFQIGDNVKQGDLLAEIDPRLYEATMEASTAQLQSLRAQLSDMQASLELARKQAARNDQLIKTKAISRDAADVTAAALKSAQAHVEAQKAAITQMESKLQGDKTNLSYTKIYAPISGTISTLPTKEGQTLNANQTAPTILQIADLDTMTIRAQVAEADVMRLRGITDVSFTTLGSLDKHWKGTVRQLLPSPEVINDVVLYDVLIDVDNRERQLMNGMSTQISFQIGNAHDVPVLPVEALGPRAPKDDNGQGRAYRVQKKGAGEIIIHVGLMDRANAEIKDGLSEGDEVTVTRSKTKKPAMGGPQRLGPAI